MMAKKKEPKTGRLPQKKKPKYSAATMAVIDAATHNVAILEAFKEIVATEKHEQHKDLAVASQKFYILIFKANPKAFPSGYDASLIDWKAVKKYFEKN